MPADVGRNPMIDLGARQSLVVDDAFGDSRLGSSFGRIVEFMRDRHNILPETERIQNLRAARQERADFHSSAHLPWPSHTRNVTENGSRSFTLAPRSSQMFSTEGYSRKSFQDWWS